MFSQCRILQVFISTHDVEKCEVNLLFSLTSMKKKSRSTKYYALALEKYVGLPRFIFSIMKKNSVQKIAHMFYTHQPNEDFNIRNVQAKRSFNLWLGMYANAEKHIFEILPHSLFEGSPNSKAKPPNRPKCTACIAYSKKDCVVGFQKCVFLH